MTQLIVLHNHEYCFLKEKNNPTMKALNLRLMHSVEEVQQYFDCNIQLLDKGELG